MAYFYDIFSGCFGGYSYKAVINDKPGEKEHEYKHAVFCCIPKDATDIKELKVIKNRVKS